MKVLLVCGTTSTRLQKELFDKYNLTTGFAIQKYYKLLEEGFLRNGIDIETLSIVPIPKAKAPFVFKRFKKEKEQNVTYCYVPYIRFAPLYHVFMLLSMICRVFWWTLRHRKDGVVLCDILIPCLCIGTAWGAALARGKRIAWVTDMPGMSGTRCKHYAEMGVLGKLQIRCIRKFSGFIFMTEQTNGILNPKNKPYIIMEGLVDPDVKPLNGVRKNKTRDILYAGGLSESYGLGYLCEAFLKLKHKDARLVIYGDGDYKNKIIDYSALNPHIVYRGLATNDIIVEAERKATLLVNPRFTGSEYTLYSFPSKNIEYMVSGTPIVTTRLAGIPIDYEQYIFTFDEETVDGYAETLDNLLEKSEKELVEFGAAAQVYVLENKNARLQVERLLQMIEIVER